MPVNFSKIWGSALLSALFIMTLVAIAATAMTTRLQLDIYRTHLTIDSDELYLATQAVTFWGMDTLKDLKKLKVNGKNGKLAALPPALQTIYPGVTLKGEIMDMQALFNINNLLDRKFHSSFFRLLENTLVKSDDTQRKALFYALYYWISPYQPERGQDQYIKHYLKQTPSYLPAYQPLQNISELRLVEGVTSERYQRLLTSFTALPEITPININTAPKHVLASLGNWLSETQVDELIQERNKGIRELNDIHKLLQKLNIPNEQITLESSYYLIVGRGTTEDLNLVKYTVVKRNKDINGKISISIITESLNSI